MTEAEQIIAGAERQTVVDIRVADGEVSARVHAHNMVMNRMNALIGTTNWALVATDDEYELLAARLGALS